MNSIFNILVYRPNKWYDSLKDPYRFLVFCLIVILPLTSLHTAATFTPYVFHFMTLWFMYAFMLFIWRMMYIELRKTNDRNRS